MFWIGKASVMPVCCTNSEILRIHYRTLSVATSSTLHHNHIRKHFYLAYLTTPESVSTGTPLENASSTFGPEPTEVANTTFYVNATEGRTSTLGPEPTQVVNTTVFVNATENVTSGQVFPTQIVNKTDITVNTTVLTTETPGPVTTLMVSTTEHDSVLPTKNDTLIVTSPGSDSRTPSLSPREVTTPTGRQRSRMRIHSAVVIPTANRRTIFKLVYIFVTVKKYHSVYLKKYH